MKKKLILIFFFTLPILLVFVVVSNFRSIKQSPTAPSKPVTPAAFSILDTSPKNNEANIQPTSPISLTVSVLPPLSSVAISISPKTEFTLSTFENLIVITPKQPLKTNTFYRVTFTSELLSSPYSFSFTTSPTTIGGQAGPDPRTVERMEQQYREATPDSFLASHLPHDEIAFSMTSYLNWNTGRSKFIVATKGSDPNKSRQDALFFMKSLGLTDLQIAGFTISYQNQNVVSLKENLPYYGNFFNISYDKSFDKTSITIMQAHKTEGEEELNTFLKSKGIPDRSEIPNLEVKYL